MAIAAEPTQFYAARTRLMKVSTLERSRSDCLLRSTADATIWSDTRVVSVADWFTPEIVVDTDWVPWAAWSMLRAISLVVAFCSSTAAAMVEEISLISLMVRLMA